MRKKKEKKVQIPEEKSSRFIKFTTEKLQKISTK